MKKALVFTACLVLAAGTAFAAKLTIVSPNGGETNVCIGQPYSIKWTAQNVTQKVKLLLFKDGAKVELIANDLNANGSPFSWTVSGAAGTGYKIRVRTMDNGLDDFSDNPFEIKASCGGGGIDPGIFEKLRKMRRIAIKWPPDPDPCRCPEFDISQLRDALGSPTQLVKIQLLKNGALLQELGSFKPGAVLPASLKGKLGLEDYRLFRQGGAAFSLALANERGIILQNIALEDAAREPLVR
jgi:hypothetical protein